MLSQDMHMIVNGIAKIDKPNDLEVVQRAVKDAQIRFESVKSNKLCIGQQISFEARGMVHVGKITKFLQRNVRVMVDDGKTWTVNPRFLNPV